MTACPPVNDRRRRLVRQRPTPPHLDIAGPPTMRMRASLMTRPSPTRKQGGVKSRLGCAPWNPDVLPPSRLRLKQAVKATLRRRRICRSAVADHRLGSGYSARRRVRQFAWHDATCLGTRDRGCRLFLRPLKGQSPAGGCDGTHPLIGLRRDAFSEPARRHELPGCPVTAPAKQRCTQVHCLVAGVLSAGFRGRMV